GGQPLQGLRGGVAVSIVAHGDGRQLRPQGQQQLLRGGIFGSVVACHQQFDVRQVSVFDQASLNDLIHVSGNEGVELPGGAQHAEALLIDVTAAQRRVDGQGAAPQGQVRPLCQQQGVHAILLRQSQNG